MSLRRVDVAEMFTRFRDPWSPKVVGELNGQMVKLVRFQGEFVWHKHDHEDEMFLVIAGAFRMELRDGNIELTPGQLLVMVNFTRLELPRWRRTGIMLAKVARRVDAPPQLCPIAVRAARGVGCEP